VSKNVFDEANARDALATAVGGAAALALPARDGRRGGLAEKGAVASNPSVRRPALAGGISDASRTSDPNAAVRGKRALPPNRKLRGGAVP
jgi:hypothetical protein